MYSTVKDKHKWGTENLSVMKGILGNIYMWPVILIGWIYYLCRIILLNDFKKSLSSVWKKNIPVYTDDFYWNYGRI